MLIFFFFFIQDDQAKEFLVEVPVVFEQLYWCLCCPRGVCTEERTQMAPFRKLPALSPLQHATPRTSHTHTHTHDYTKGGCGLHSPVKAAETVSAGCRTDCRLTDRRRSRSRRNQLPIHLINYPSPNTII